MTVDLNLPKYVVRQLMPYFYYSNSPAVWYKIEELSSMLYYFLVIEQQAPKSMSDLKDLPLEIGMVSIKKLKKLRANYKAGQDTQILQIVATLACIVFRDADCIESVMDIDLATCTPDLKQVLYFVKPNARSKQLMSLY